MTVAEVMVVLDDARLNAPVDVGLLSRERRGTVEVIRFAYSEAWLEEVPEAFPIDPELPLYAGDQFPRGTRELFGVFRDTSPDRWGRVLMERREALEARTDERKPRRLGEWAFLLGVSDATRMGALRLRERGSEQRFVDYRALGAPPAARLRELEAIARAIDAPDSEERPEYAAWLRQLVAPGSSLGGARPKATFAAPDGTLWIAKFPGRQDRFDVGAWEFLAHELARSAGISVPDARLMELGSEHHTFAVRRFDREGDRRRLYASAMTLLLRDDGDAASYVEIAQALQDNGEPETIASDLEQLYRRVIFNVLIGNRDDHLRNHGFLRGRRGWRLAPAFDLNPNPYRDEHALALDESSASPSLSAVRKTHDFYRLSSAAAPRIEQQVRAALDDWPRIARSIGIRGREIERLEAVIDPSMDA
jgi:serine/threonine-protein kinase HipA